MKIKNAHSFTFSEENLIKEAIYYYFKQMEDEDGKTEHLPPHKRDEYQRLVELLNNF